MDRRQQKTRASIFQAFSKLLEHKRYENITVQEIINEANIGRSTFYAHFETKDELLRAMCTDIFEHVFQKRLPQEEEQAYSHGSKNLQLKLEHILFHLRENKLEFEGILKSESSELFMGYFKEYLVELFARYLDDFTVDVPKHFLLHHLVGSFSEAVMWWLEEDTKETPEEVSRYFMAVLHP